MTEFQKAAQHRVLPTRRIGDTLVVTPSGSLAGYGANEVNGERSRLAKLLAEPEIESLIIDLHDADYFGSEMIGIFVRLQQACRGRVALVGVTHGMRKVLEVMRLEELFSVYGSKKHALRAVARIPLRERLNPRFVLAGGVALALTTSLLFTATSIGSIRKLPYQVFGSPAARDYCTLNQLWSEFSESERTRRTVEEEIALRNELNRNLEQLDSKVATRNSGSDSRTADQLSLEQAVHSFEAVLKSGGDVGAEMTFLHRMYCARNNISRRTGLELPVPVQPRSENDA